MKCSLSSVHVFLAFPCSAMTGDFDFFSGELVVVSQLFSRENLPQCEDDDVLLPQNIADFTVAVWITGVVDEPSRIALECCVNDEVIIDPKHVAADSLAVVELFPVVGEHCPDFLPSVLDDHLPALDLTLTEETHAMDAAAVHPDRLSSVLGEMAEPHCHGKVQACGTSLATPHQMSFR